MHSSFARSRQSLFDEEEAAGGTPSNSNSLFQDDSAGGGSPWDMPTPRKQKSRGDLLRSLLPASDAPDSYIETFDSVVRDDGSSASGKVSPAGLMRVLAAAKLDADAQAKIMNIIAPGGGGEDVTLGRNEFNVFLGLIGLAQEGETVSLDGIDERRRSKSLVVPCFWFIFFVRTIFRLGSTRQPASYIQYACWPAKSQHNESLLHMQPPVPLVWCFISYPRPPKSAGWMRSSVGATRIGDWPRIYLPH